MRLSTSFRYGARAITELASTREEHAVSVREVAKQQGVSAKYLEHIFRALRTAGLVQAVRGGSGGYVLAKPPERITLMDLFDSLEGPVAPTECVNRPDSCPMQEVCPTKDVWIEIKEAVESVLKRTTIQSLVERRRQRPIASTPMYHI